MRRWDDLVDIFQNAELANQLVEELNASAFSFCSKTSTRWVRVTSGSSWVVEMDIRSTSGTKVMLMQDTGTL